MPRKPLIALLLGLVLFAGCGDSGEDAPEKPFEPSASLQVIGGSVRTDKPDFVMTVEGRRGDANIRSAAVELPTAVLADVTAIGRLCTETELVEEECAKRQPLGRARVQSPAYDGELTGPVFAVTGSGRLPRLAYVLDGPAQVLLRGPVVSKRGRIQAGVDDVPDTPLERFELRIAGGKRGYLILSRNICRTPAYAEATFTSQAGQDRAQRIPLEADCG